MFENRTMFEFIANSINEFFVFFASIVTFVVAIPTSSDGTEQISKGVNVLNNVQ